MPPLVSVVVPVHNAEETLRSTVESALRQTYSNLEVIAVNDGSTDNSREIIRHYASIDQRIRLIEQDNGGVASARNAGIAAARGEFIAPLDADDLWHEDKIRRQVECFRANGLETGLVYNWYRRIGADDSVLKPSPSPIIEGWVLHRHLDWNFVSNGSTPLIRANLLQQVRYDERLRRSGNEGCEDYLLQLELAKRAKFACVPAFLTGYRRRGGEMSADVARMIRSHIQMYAMVGKDLGAAGRRLAREKIAAFSVELARNRIKRGRLSETADAVIAAARQSPTVAIRHGWSQVRLGIGRMQFLSPSSGYSSSIVGRKFAKVDPNEADGLWQPRRRAKRLAALTALDQLWDGRGELSSAE